MRSEFAKWEIKTSVFSGRKSQAGNCWYRLNDQRLEGHDDAAAFAAADGALRAAVTTFGGRGAAELTTADLHPRGRAAWRAWATTGQASTVFVEHPEVPMDNNTAEPIGTRAGGGSEELLRQRVALERSKTWTGSYHGTSARSKDGRGDVRMRARRRTRHSHVAWSRSDEEFQSQTPRPA